MVDSTKTMRLTDHEIASQPYGSREDGQVQDMNGNFFQRFHSWIKLDNFDAKSEHGRWSNAGKSMKKISRTYSNIWQTWSQCHQNCKHGGLIIVGL